MPDELNNGEIIDRFVLPREDWYDDQGRIYKDALIENFNAIEAKLLQITRLDAFQTSLPDISSISYPDIENIEDAEDNQIINLKTFLDLTGLIGYPLEIVTSGKTIKKICYWGADYQYHQLTNKTLAITGSTRYIYLNYVTNRLSHSGTPITPENSLLIGYYTDGAIKHVNVFDYGFINVLYYLSRMRIETLDIDMQNSVNFREHSTHTGHNLNGATVGGTDLDTGSGSTGKVRFNRIGRTSA